MDAAAGGVTADVTAPTPPDPVAAVTDDGSVVRSAAGMGAVAAVSRVLGSLRVLVIAAVLGTTYLGNAFQSANTFSTVLFELLAAGALSAVLVPPFVGWLDTGRRDHAERMAGELLGLALVVLGALSVVGVLAAPWIAELLTAAVDDPTIRAEQVALTTFLLRFFIPQIVLYGVGAISTALLHAQRVFVVPAAAPIGNTVVLVGFLVAFAVVAGPDPGLDLTLGEQLLLAAGGTLGVAAFVAIPTVALVRRGFPFRPRRPTLGGDLGRLLRLSSWATVQHLGAGLLLAAALIVGGGVEGGVVAFQVGWVFFQAPYGVLAQPINTVILPEISRDAADGDDEALARGLRWALDSMALLLVPLSAAGVVFAVPVLEVLAVGQAGEGDGARLLGVAVASLSVGLLGYGAFLMLARAFYALGDSRTPAVVSLLAALVGVAAMVVGSPFAEGSARVALLGLAHSAAFTAAAVALGVILHRRLGQRVFPRVLPSVLVASVAVAVPALVWLRAWDPDDRVSTLLAIVVVGGAAALVSVALLRLLHLAPHDPRPSRRTEP